MEYPLTDVRRQRKFGPLTLKFKIVYREFRVKAWISKPKSDGKPRPLNKQLMALMYRDGLQMKEKLTTTFFVKVAVDQKDVHAIWYENYFANFTLTFKDFNEDSVLTNLNRVCGGLTDISVEATLKLEVHGETFSIEMQGKKLDELAEEVSVTSRVSLPGKLINRFLDVNSGITGTLNAKLKLPEEAVTKRVSELFLLDPNLKNQILALK